MKKIILDKSAINHMKRSSSFEGLTDESTDDECLAVFKNTRPRLRRLFKKIMREAQKSGLKFEDELEMTEPNYNNLDQTFFDCTYHVDMIYLYFYKDDEYLGLIQWIGCNEDECVLTDWHTELEQYIPSLVESFKIDWEE